MAKTGLVICGHGSRAKDAEVEFGLLAEGVKQRFPDMPVEHGFLEYSAPNIHMGLDSLLAQGVTDIVAVPGMLFAATHAKNDIPSVLTTYQDKHPGLTVRYGRELGLHADMIRAFEGRILEALELPTAPADGDLYDTMLVVVGRGTSDSEANAEVAKLTRIVTENLGFGWSEVVYSGVTFPSVGRGLEMALKLGFKKIVVAPYFLFTGKLIRRIYNYVDKVAEANPEVSFHKAHYLKDSEFVMNALEARFREVLEPGEAPGGLMQSFQQRLARGEIDVHHHHAEFQPETLDPDDDEAAGHTHDHGHPHGHTHAHSHGDNHSHGHSHAPYRHIAHPHGPRTMIDEGLCCCFMSQFPQDVLDDERARRAEAEAEAS